MSAKLMRAICTISLAALTLVAAMPAGVAQAMLLPANSTSNSTGRPDYQGYFTDIFRDAPSSGALFDIGLVNPDGSPITTAAQFINFYQSALFRNSFWGNPDQAEAAAAYTVAFMLHGANTTQFWGPDGDPTNYTRGLAYAKNNFSTWANLINAYDTAAQNSAGWGVRFNVPETLCHPLYQGNLDQSTHDVFFFEDGSDTNCDNDSTVEFVNPPDASGNSSYFFLLMVCGNPYGTITQLSNGPNFNVDVNVAPAQTVRPGGTATLNVSLQNTSSTSQVPAGTLEAYQFDAAHMAAACAGNCALTPPQQTDLNNVTSGGQISTLHGYRQSASLSGQSGANWYWATNQIPINTLVQGSFQFTVPSSAPPGPFSVKVCFGPANAGGGVQCATVTVTVAAIRNPTVVSQSGDIYGGGHVAVGGSCTQLGTSSNVSANPGSYGDYLIAATGTITASPSSNGSGGGTSLKLGATGGYAEICRPDLLSSALSYTGTVNPITTTDFDVTDKSGVWEYTGGGTLKVHGTITQPLTVVATSPAAIVQFDSNVVVDPAIQAFARNLPSLGVIANGNIFISSSVTKLEAYLFSSSGTIDTCRNADASCNNQLTVNGFLMASNITFGRLGPNGTTGAQLAELITLTPQLYLNPPILFDGVATNVSLNGEGEKQPLF
ncbi:MAG TPA: hypothetical protein VI322_05375 [Candidatus Saccharimonadia bacterium]